MAEMPKAHCRRERVQAVVDPHEGREQAERQHCAGQGIADAADGGAGFECGMMVPAMRGDGGKAKPERAQRGDTGIEHRMAQS